MITLMLRESCHFISTGMALQFPTVLKLSIPFILFFFKQNLQRKHDSVYRIPHSVIFFHSSFKSTIKYKMRYDCNYTIPPPTSPTSFSTYTLSTFIYFVVLGNNTQSLICSFPVSLDQGPFTGPIKTYQQTHPQITWLSLFHFCP